MNPSKQLQFPRKGMTTLADIDPGQTFDAHDKAEADLLLEAIHDELQSLQVALHAEGKRSLLVVLQAVDAGGKDGTIRKVFGPLNPHWVRVTDFKAPTPAELAHDYLWRVHQAVPARGTIGIFNRSHYEDVLIARVRELAPADEIKRRYRQIVEFERNLVENGTTILKFYLHISKAEQRKRFKARIEEPDKRWKFNPADLAERDLWPQYMDAYERALSLTSTNHAPWFVIPSDRKWSRNVLVAEIVVNALRAMRPKHPAIERQKIKIPR